jgi:predicted alpha/beta hydrolase family esterase
MQRSYLIVHGWAGNEPTHWQTWLAERLRSTRDHVRYPELPNFDQPDLTEWLAVLTSELNASFTSPQPRTVVCHSLGAILWMHHAARRGARVDRVLLVAPPGPDCGIAEVEAFFPVPLDAQAIRAAARETILVYADDDPYCQSGAATVFAGPLRIPSVLIPGGGHLNVAAGYGPWPEMEAWTRGGPMPENDRGL